MSWLLFTCCVSLLCFVCPSNDLRTSYIYPANSVCCDYIGLQRRRKTCKYSKFLCTLFCFYLGIKCNWSCVNLDCEAISAFQRFMHDPFHFISEWKWKKSTSSLIFMFIKLPLRHLFTFMFISFINSFKTRSVVTWRISLIKCFITEE